MTSAGGTISFDPDTYTLIITDTPDAIRNIKSVVERLDV
jgi:type II secretory pathway component GspD/PulD (secretin)